MSRLSSSGVKLVFGIKTAIVRLVVSYMMMNSLNIRLKSSKLAGLELNCTDSKCTKLMGCHEIDIEKHYSWSG